MTRVVFLMSQSVGTYEGDGEAKECVVEAQRLIAWNAVQRIPGFGASRGTNIPDAPSLHSDPNAACHAYQYTGEKKGLPLRGIIWDCEASGPASRGLFVVHDSLASPLLQFHEDLVRSSTNTDDWVVATYSSVSALNVDDPAERVFELLRSVLDRPGPRGDWVEAFLRAVTTDARMHARRYPC